MLNKSFPIILEVFKYDIYYRTINYHKTKLYGTRKIPIFSTIFKATTV